MIEPSVGVNPVRPGWPGFVSAVPYGVLTRTTAPTAQLLSLAQAKAHLRVPLDQSDDDEDIKLMIFAVTDWIERILDRALFTQAWTLWLDAFPWWRSPIVLPKPPTQAVTSITYYDQDGTLQTWASTNYLVVLPAGPTAQRAQIVPAAGVSYPLLPSFALTQRRPDAVQIAFTCGWADTAVPPAIQAAAKLLLGHLYMNREAAVIQRGSSDVLPFGVEALLAPYLMQVY